MFLCRYYWDSIHWCGNSGTAFHVAWLAVSFFRFVVWSGFFKFAVWSDFFKGVCFRDPIRVPRIRENYHRVARIRENRVPRIRETGSLQVHIGCVTFSLKKNWVRCTFFRNYNFDHQYFTRRIIISNQSAWQIINHCTCSTVLFMSTTDNT